MARVCPIGRPTAMQDLRPCTFLADTAHAGPVVHEEGLRELDAYFEWRRTEESPSNDIPEK